MREFLRQFTRDSVDPRIKEWERYIGSDGSGSGLGYMESGEQDLYPVSDNRSLNQRMRQAQSLREKGIHIPAPRSKTSYIDLGKNIGKVPVNIGALGGMTQAESNQASKRAAQLGEAVWDYGTIPFYFTPAAPVAAGFDVARGVVNEDPIEVGLSMLGVGRPLKSIAPTMSEAAERALTWGTGIASAQMSVFEFLKSLSKKKDEGGKK
jgi:hypothetical protein